jgi:hypothetical protein
MFAVRRTTPAPRSCRTLPNARWISRWRAFRVKRQHVCHADPWPVERNPRSGDGERATDESLDTARGFVSMLASIVPRPTTVDLGLVGPRNTGPAPALRVEEFSRKSEKYVEGEMGAVGECSMSEKEVRPCARCATGQGGLADRVPSICRGTRQEVIMVPQRTHNDIARLVQTMYAEDFVCSTGATARSSSS